MDEVLPQFETIVRRARQFSDAKSTPVGGLHPFEERNIHPRIPQQVTDLFDNGHYPQATFEAYKFLDKEVQRFATSTETGFKLMMQAFSEEAPLIKLTPLGTTSEIDEQKGFRFVFAGSILAIRNPRGHEIGIIDTPDQCLDHLSLASMLLRRLEEAGFK